MPMKEPSVLDLLKEKVTFWQKKPEGSISGSRASSVKESVPSQKVTEQEASSKRFSLGPWKILAALFFAIISQLLLEPPDRSIKAAISLYGLSAFLVVAALVTHDWDFPSMNEGQPGKLELEFKRLPFYFSLPFLMLAFFAFGGNRFTMLNLGLWFLGLSLLIYSLWLPGDKKVDWSAWIKKRKESLLTIKVTPWVGLMIIAIALVVFFRFNQLDQVPGEMFSDHAEKLLDVSDVLNGQYSIFFPRNTGREFIQMYLTAAIVIICKTGLSFMSLKIGTVLAGLLTLPFIYLLGKEIGNRRVGLSALLFAGVAYWPNVISRIGLRFPLYALFAAPTLFFLVRGLKRQTRNDFILSGLFLGLSVHGYSPARFLPIVILAAFTIYLIHPESKGNRLQVITSLVIVAGMSFAVFLPLLRYAIDDPEGFSIRAFSRVLGTEQPLPGPAWQIFLSNTWKAMIMFFYDNGEIWVHSIPHRPALDYVTGALFAIGIVLLFARYVKRRKWWDLFLLVSIPLLMMPSILSLAFPAENPSLNRTSAAIIPVFIIAGIAFENIIQNLYKRLSSFTGKSLSLLLGIVLLAWCSILNYNLVFTQFKDQFMAGAWNTSEIGKVIRGFADSVGSENSAYVVPFPYWVDTRLVGINAGFPTKDYALWPDQFEQTLSESQTKLFILKEEDNEDLKLLQDMYPNGTVKLFDNPREGKDFWIFTVPAEQ